MIKSKCKPFTIGYSKDKSTLITKTDPAEIYKVQYVELRAENIESEKPKANFKFTKDMLHMETAETTSMMYDVTQYYSSAKSTKGYKRMIPVSLVGTWVTSYNKMVTAYDDAIEAYEKLVLNFNLVHAPAATKKAFSETFDADLTAALKDLPKLKTADEPPIDSTRIDLPEMPYMTKMRPAPFGGPKLFTDGDIDSITAGDYVFEMGAGRVTTGWLTLKEGSVKGYGTKGQAETAISYINPVQAKETVDCKPLYLGVIAYPIID